VQAPQLNSDLDSTPTLFECVPESVAICSPITRGLAPGAHLIPVQRALYALAAHYLGTYASFDSAVIRAWHAVAARDWRFLFVVLPGIDGNTHFTDPYHESVQSRYRAVDHALGVFIQRCRQSSRHAPPDFLIVSDHGAEVVREHCDIALALEARGYPTVRHPFHVWRARARAAVMVSGNSAAHVYLEPHSGRIAPRVLDEVPDAVLDFLVDLPAVELAACRDGARGVHVLARTGRAHITEHDGVITYSPQHGDPLGLGQSPLVLEERAMLARTVTGNLPDAPRQLLNLLGAPRAGDIVLAARRGFDFRGPWEVPEHKSGHGSLLTEHMRVPIASSVPLPDSPMRTVDLMPTILEHLGLPVPDGIDGIPATRLEHERSIA
jgi:arylsulfatase A-like enzyme